MIRYSFMLMIRNKRRSFTIFCTILTLTLILGGYFKTILDMEQRMNEIYNKILVTGEIVGRDQPEDVYIPFSVVEEIIQTGFIKRAKLSTRDYACIVDPLIGAWIIKDNYETYPEIISFYSLDLEELSKDIEITFLNGYDESSFMSDEPICILSETILNQYNMKLGQQIQMIALNGYKEHNSESKFNGTYFKICGYFKLLPTDDTVLKDSSLSPIMENDTIVPIRSYMKQLSQLYEYAIPRNDLEYKSCIRSAYFEFQNTKELKEFRRFLMGTSFGKDISMIKDTKLKNLKFELDDNELNNLITPLTRSLQTLYKIIPIVLILIGCISFFIAFLFTKLCGDSMYLMRILGESKNSVLRKTFLELFLPGFGAVFVGYMILLWYQKAPKSMVYGLFFLCYIISIYLCIYIQLRKPLDSFKNE